MMPVLNLPKHEQRISEQDGQQMIFCQVRRKLIVLTPEEWVRQHLISFLNRDLGHPLSLMCIERQVKGGLRHQRADLIVYDPKGNPNILIECKAPHEKLGRQTFFQVGRYNRYITARYLLITNGMQHYCCTRSDEGDFVFLDHIPRFGSDNGD